MPAARILLSALLLLQNPDFGAKFFDDLKTLFGHLETSELDTAFKQAKAIRCSDLIGRSGEWKVVGFLNDNRAIAAWHYEDIESVKKDLVRYVFSGRCINEQSPLNVTTHYPIQDSGKVRDNPPVSVLFDRPTDSYTFRLPFLYPDGPTPAERTYTLTPPTATSRIERELTDEFRCKAISDVDLTYRFLLCRTQLLNVNAAANQKTQDLPGSRAYYIFSDGREASSTVKLSFETETKNPKAPEPEPDTPIPASAVWVAAPSQSKLIEIANGEFRLHFDSAAWTSRVGKPQRIGSCTWQPASAAQAERVLAADAEILYTLGFRKQAASGMSVSVDVDNPGAGRIGVLECNFAQSQTPADITVGQWNSVAGLNIAIEVRPR